MIAAILSYWYVLPLLWLANGIRKALFKPRLRIISVRRSKAGTFVELDRQQLLPPWLVFRENWARVESRVHSKEYDFAREDGVLISSDRFGPAHLDVQLEQMLIIQKAREDETDELLKEETRGRSSVRVN